MAKKGHPSDTEAVREVVVSPTESIDVTLGIPHELLPNTQFAEAMSSETRAQAIAAEERRLEGLHAFVEAAIKHDYGNLNTYWLKGDALRSGIFDLEKKLESVALFNFDDYSEDDRPKLKLFDRAKQYQVAYERLLHNFIRQLFNVSQWHIRHDIRFLQLPPEGDPRRMMPELKQLYEKYKAAPEDNKQLVINEMRVNEKIRCALLDNALKMKRLKYSQLLRNEIAAENEEERTNADSLFVRIDTYLKSTEYQDELNQLNQLVVEIFPWLEKPSESPELWARYYHAYSELATKVQQFLDEIEPPQKLEFPFGEPPEVGVEKGGMEAARDSVEAPSHAPTHMYGAVSKPDKDNISVKDIEAELNRVRERTALGKTVEVPRVGVVDVEEGVFYFNRTNKELRALEPVSLKDIFAHASMRVDRLSVEQTSTGACVTFTVTNRDKKTVEWKVQIRPAHKEAGSKRSVEGVEVLVPTSLEEDEKKEFFYTHEEFRKYLSEDVFEIMRRIRSVHEVATNTDLVDAHDPRGKYGGHAATVRDYERFGLRRQVSNYFAAVDTGENAPALKSRGEGYAHLTPGAAKMLAEKLFAKLTNGTPSPATSTQDARPSTADTVAPGVADALIEGGTTPSEPTLPTPEPRVESAEPFALKSKNTQWVVMGTTYWGKYDVKKGQLSQLKEKYATDEPEKKRFSDIAHESFIFKIATKLGKKEMVPFVEHTGDVTALVYPDIDARVAFHKTEDGKLKVTTEVAGTVTEIVAGKDKNFIQQMIKSVLELVRKAPLRDTPLRPLNETAPAVAPDTHRAASDHTSSPDVPPVLSSEPTPVPEQTEAAPEGILPHVSYDATNGVLTVSAETGPTQIPLAVEELARPIPVVTMKENGFILSYEPHVARIEVSQKADNPSKYTIHLEINLSKQFISFSGKRLSVIDDTQGEGIQEFVDALEQTEEGLIEQIELIAPLLQGEARRLLSPELVERPGLTKKVSPKVEKQMLDYIVQFDQDEQKLMWNGEKISVAVEGLGACTFDPTTLTYTYVDENYKDESGYAYSFRLRIPTADTLAEEGGMPLVFAARVAGEKLRKVIMKPEDVARTVESFKEWVARDMVEWQRAHTTTEPEPESEIADPAEPAESTVELSEAERERIGHTLRYNSDENAIEWIGTEPKRKKKKGEGNKRDEEEEEVAEGEDGKVKSAVDLDIEVPDIGALELKFDAENWTGTYITPDDSEFTFRIRSVPRPQSRDDRNRRSPRRSGEGILAGVGDSDNFMLEIRAAGGKRKGRSEIHSSRDLVTAFRVLKKFIANEIAVPVAEAEAPTPTPAPEVRRTFEDTPQAPDALPEAQSLTEFAKAYVQLRADKTPGVAQPLAERTAQDRVRLMKLLTEMSVKRLQSPGKTEDILALPVIEPDLPVIEQTTLSLATMRTLIAEAGLEIIGERRATGSPTPVALRVRWKQSS